MFDKMLVWILAVALSVGAAFAGEMVNEDLFVDTFDTPHDYLSQGAAGTGWDGFVGLGPDETANAIDANQTRKGQLYLESAFNSRYQEFWHPLGPFLYKIVEGDFVATVRISDYAGSPDEPVEWNNCGLMARNVEDADAGEGEDWVSNDYFPLAGQGNTVRLANDDIRSEPFRNGLGWGAYTHLRLQRRGNAFHFFASPDGKTWTKLHVPEPRWDFNGLPVQVGVFQAVYSENVGYAAFDDFQLEFGIKRAELVSPENAAEDMGVDRPISLEWTPGDTAAFHDVYFGLDPNDLEFQGRQPLADTQFTVSDLQDGTTYYWRVDQAEADEVTIHTGNTWSFTTVYLHAHHPNPAEGLSGVPLDNAQLSWDPAEGSEKHRVYLSLDREAVEKANKYTQEYMGTTSETHFAPQELQLETTYYWRVDEHDRRDSLLSKGDIWSFTTIKPHIPLDDFESYNDIDEGEPESNRIYLTWSDGWDDPGNGSQVGYTEIPLVEHTIVHGGAQSMPFHYDNSAATVSQVTREFVAPRNWLNPGGNDLVCLSLWLHGQANNAALPLYVEIRDIQATTAVEMYTEAPNPLISNTWTEWQIDLAKIGAAGVDLSRIKRISIGIGYPDNPQLGGKGLLFVDDINLFWE